jgi:hypothetical protein
MKINQITEAINGAAMEVHREMDLDCQNQPISNFSVTNYPRAKFLSSWNDLCR